MRFILLLGCFAATSVFSMLACSPSGEPQGSGEDSVVSAEEAPPAASAPQGGDGVTIIQKWEMPDDLLEISGICWVDAQRLAAIEDEKGSIFIYNLASSKIEREIPFGAAGDYEAIAKVEDVYYVMRSDARIFEVATAGGKPAVQEYDAAFDKKHDIETLFYDAANKRLLFTDKATGKKDSKYTKAIYAFTLADKKTSAEPVMEINMENPVLEKHGGKKGGKKKDEKKDEKKFRIIQPSDIAIHPTTGDIYLTDGPQDGLFITDRTGKAKQYIELDKKIFPQPEGVTFSPSGDLFLSSEGVKGKGVIAKVRL